MEYKILNRVSKSKIKTIDFNDFITKIKNFKLVETTDLEDVIKETKDLVIKTDKYMTDGVLDKGEFLLTIFEANDVMSSLLKSVEKAGNTLQESVEQLISLSDEKFKTDQLSACLELLQQAEQDGN